MHFKPQKLRLYPNLKTSFVLVGSLFLSACASSDGHRSGPFEPFRISIQQGNYITNDAVKQLREGMTREQVRVVMGTPLVEDVFRKDRWDYLFHYIQPSGKTETRRAAIFFDPQGRLLKVEATELPASEAVDDPVLSRGRR